MDRLQESIWYDPTTMDIRMLKIFKIFKQVIKFTRVMENWRVEILAGGQHLSKIEIQRDILHEKLLTHLLFVNDATKSSP